MADLCRVSGPAPVVKKYGSVVGLAEDHRAGDWDYPQWIILAVDWDQVCLSQLGCMAKWKVPIQHRGKVHEGAQELSLQLLVPPAVGKMEILV